MWSVYFVANITFMYLPFCFIIIYIFNSGYMRPSWDSKRVTKHVLLIYYFFSKGEGEFYYFALNLTFKYL